MSDCPRFNPPLTVKVPASVTLFASLVKVCSGGWTGSLRISVESRGDVAIGGSKLGGGEQKDLSVCLCQWSSIMGENDG